MLKVMFTQRDRNTSYILEGCSLILFIMNIINHIIFINRLNFSVASPFLFRNKLADSGGQMCGEQSRERERGWDERMGAMLIGL